MPANGTTASGPRTRRIAIIGAGPGGLCAAIRLKRAGFSNITIFERAAGVGGTWYHNRYPGATCDVQSHLYSFSFEQKRDWTRPYATQPEIKEYLDQCVKAYDLEPHLRLNTGVASATWDDHRSHWALVTDGGESVEADVVVSGIGMFNDLHVPEIPGLADFAGTIFHSARWNHDHDLTGETVGVIGSAASAVQFVPEIAKQAGQVHLFQRTANWVLPKADTPYTAEEVERFVADPLAVAQHRWQVFRTIEGAITFSNPQALQMAEHYGRQNIALVDDPELRRKLTPTEPYGCKRPLISNEYYPTFNRPNVELVTEGVRAITADSITTVDGRSRPVDTIVLATGFATDRYLSAIAVTGRNGTTVDRAWADGAQAYLGITTAGFPNLFMLYGPNTNNGSIIAMIEHQVAYVVRQLRRMDADDLDWIDVRPEAMERYNTELQHDLDAVAVWQAGCNGYYRSTSGRIVTQWPHTMSEYRRRTQRPDADAYVSAPATGQLVM